MVQRAFPGLTLTDLKCKVQLCGAEWFVFLRPTLLDHPLVSSQQSLLLVLAFSPVGPTIRVGGSKDKLPLCLLAHVSKCWGRLTNLTHPQLAPVRRPMCTRYRLGDSQASALLVWSTETDWCRSLA